jgi:hypothetical protein
VQQVQQHRSLEGDQGCSPLLAVEEKTSLPNLVLVLVRGLALEGNDEQQALSGEVRDCGGSDVRTQAVPSCLVCGTKRNQ